MVTSDPFLLAHQAGPRVFNLAGKLSPVSLRDQMVRAYWFVERAIEAGVISPGAGRGLLILGGGACGVTAAICAAQRGIPTVLIERSQRLLSTQARCATRWIDPSQYDWPNDHWARGYFPVNGVPMPLSWRAGWSHQLARSWRSQLNLATGLYGARLLSVHVGGRVKVHRTRPRSPAVTADIKVPNRGLSTQSFGAALMTVGFGLEATSVTPNFRGYAFWESDPYSQPKLGLPTQPRIVISGAGDGALQDFLRVTTRCKSAAEVMNVLRVPSGVAQNLKDLERQCAALSHWGSDPKHDHPVHEALDAQYEDEARQLLAVGGIKQRLASLLTASARSVQLYHRCSHLTAFYGLNRFLTLLITEYMQEQERMRLRVRRASVIQVDGVSPHQCAASPKRCHGKDHKVTWVQWPDCTQTPAGPPRQSIHADVVIVRHGLTAQAHMDSWLTPHAHPRQVLPYYLI